jgi:uncharacterized protein
MRVLISGSSGLVGAALVRDFSRRGCEVVRLTRPPSGLAPNSVPWDPERQILAVDFCEGFDAVIHLAGENLAATRWTREQKEKIYKSRVVSTRLLSQTLSALRRPPRVFLSASAIGYYGERGENLLTERDEAGHGFLCDVVKAWEAAAAPAAEAGIRTIHLRFGIILSPLGGTLKELLLPFRFGLGGPLVGGSQYFSWISLSEIPGIVNFAMDTPLLSGSVNVVAPQPLRQVEFARVLGQVLHRPARINIPKFMLNLKLGEELADCVLWSQRVIPERLLSTGFSFAEPNLETALRSMLNRAQSCS